jgi:hypothetical protein
MQDLHVIFSIQVNFLIIYILCVDFGKPFRMKFKSLDLDKI